MSQTEKGWVKLHRSLRNNPRASDPEWLALWVWMLLFANHAAASVVWKGQRITLQPGQFTAGRKQIANATGICESKVVRLLNVMKTEQQIEQQTSNACSLFTILNWDMYQQSEQRIEQPANNERTASEQPANTKQECKNVRSIESKGAELGSGDLPTLADVEKQGEFVGATKEQCAAFWKYHQANNLWLNRHGRMIDVRWKLQAWVQKDRAMAQEAAWAPS